MSNCPLFPNNYGLFPKFRREFSSTITVSHRKGDSKRFNATRVKHFYLKDSAVLYRYVPGVATYAR